MADLRILIADDEPLVRTGLRRSLERMEGISVIAEARNGREALERILAERPAVALLDVQMPGMDGLEVARALPPEQRPVIVFVTAFDHYALQAFEVHAVDYLLKPFDDTRLHQAIDRARDRVRREGPPVHLEALLEALRPAPAFLERFVVRVGERILLVESSEVDWIEAADNYVRLHTPTGRHTIRDTLKQLEHKLDPALFVRIHRSTIVRIGAIAELRPLPSGDYDVRLKSGQRLTLSRTHRETFQRRVGRWG